MTSSHVITNNHLRIKKKYFNEIVLPILNKVFEKIEPIKKTYVIAGKIICLKFYSMALLKKMSSALEHNEVSEVNPPDLTVCIWDSVSTRTHLILPWENSSEYTYVQEVNTKIKNTDSFLGVYLNGEETLNLYNEQNNTAYFWIHDASNLPYWITAAPLRPILNWFLSKTGVHLIHGAVVGLNGKSVLLTAKGGSGKSTTALACLYAGMEYLGDDYITIKSGDIITAHSLFNSLKVFPQSLNIFPKLKEKIYYKDNVVAEDEKLIIFLSELFRKQMVKKSVLNAIFIPVIKNTKETRIIPATKIDTMLAMIPTTLLQLSLTESNKVTELKSIIERTPCYFLELGSDVREIPEVIKSFLSYEQ